MKKKRLCPVLLALVLVLELLSAPAMAANDGGNWSTTGGTGVFVPDTEDGQNGNNAGNWSSTVGGGVSVPGSGQTESSSSAGQDWSGAFGGGIPFDDDQAADTPEPSTPTEPASPQKRIVTWFERIDPPAWAKNLYKVLVEGSDPRSGVPCLSDEGYFALGTGDPDVEGQEIVQVECADFDLAEMYAAEGVSLGVSVFADEDYYQIDGKGDRQIDYAALRLGDPVKTSSYSGIFVTSIPKDASYDEAKKAATSYISTVFQAFDRDHPEVFWLSGKCKVRIATVKDAAGAERAYFFLVLADDKGFDMRAPDWTKEGALTDGFQRMEKAVTEILDAVTADAPGEIVRQLNRWLTEHNQYNTTPDLTTIGNEPHEALSALEGRIDRDGPVCDGYSRAFKTLCDRLDIPCILENGYAKVSQDSKGELHMWNAVEIGGQWYGVDVTWNDPSVKGFVGAKSGKENEQFLLVGLDTVVRGLTFAASHPATNKASADGVAFDNGPRLSTIAFTALTANAGLSALPFTDVAEGAWYHDSVAYVYEQGLMLGTAGDKFSPGSSITRQQLWMILARMDGADPKTMDAAREWAMTAGVSDGSDPGRQLTREQLVTMLYRYSGGQGGDASSNDPLSGFSDAGSVSDYAVDALRWAVSGGIITGMDGAIVPQGSATRAQMAAVMERFSQDISAK